MVSPGADAPPRSWWYGRRRCIPQLLVAIAFAGCASRVYAYWTDPMPPRYAERLAKLREAKKNEPRFGTKLWHKFAIGLIAVLGFLFAGLIIAATISG